MNTAVCLSNEKDTKKLYYRFIEILQIISIHKIKEGLIIYYNIWVYYWSEYRRTPNIMV
ncbi:hypothetical protein UT300006_32570 [Clostridium sp. CTA-6]